MAWVPPIAFAVVLLWASVASAQYVPPGGIPTPSFGVNEVAPAATLYVDQSTGNDANPGTIGSKKATIPRTLAAGTVVQVSGTQTTDYSTTNRLHVAGSSGSPVWIISDAASAMVFTHLIEIDGTYAILEGGTGKGIQITDTAAAVASNHIAIRTSNQSGASFVFSENGGVVDEIVFKGNVLHDTGDMFAGEAGGDQHCLKINTASHVYVLGNLFYHCNGDGVQVGDVAAGSRAATHHNYLGGNICSANRQTCLWSKQSQDTVMSGNIALNMRSIVEPVGSPSAGQYLNPASCFGGQYGARRLAIIGNSCLLSDAGIRIAGWLLADGTGVSIIGNYLWRIHSSIGPGSGGVDYGGRLGAAVALTDQGNQAVLVANNTIYDVDAGFGSVPAEGTLTYLNNIFMLTGHHDIVSDTVHPIVTYNNFDNTAIIHGDALTNSNAVIGNPQMTDPGAGTFTLQVGSPAYQAGFAYDVNTAYFAIHGVNTGLDYGTTPNIGASQADPVVPTPRTVVRLRRR